MTGSIVGAKAAWLRRRLNGRHAIRKLTAFGVVGVTASLVYAGVFTVLTRFDAGLPTLATNALAFAASAVCSYLGHYRLTFQATTAHKVGISRFLVLCGIGYLVSNGIVIACQALNLPNWILISSVIAILPIVNFLVMQFWVFATATVEQQP